MVTDGISLLLGADINIQGKVTSWIHRLSKVTLLGSGK
jgi:hypothetical protein